MWIERETMVTFICLDAMYRLVNWFEILSHFLLHKYPSTFTKVKKKHVSHWGPSIVHRNTGKTKSMLIAIEYIGENK